MSANLEKEFTKNGILETSLATEVTAELSAGRPIKWNLLLAKQLQHEKGEINEAND